MVPKQVSYRFPGIDYCTVSIQRGKVPIPNPHRPEACTSTPEELEELLDWSPWVCTGPKTEISRHAISYLLPLIWVIISDIRETCGQAPAPT